MLIHFSKSCISRQHCCNMKGDCRKRDSKSAYLLAVSISNQKTAIIFSIALSEQLFNFRRLKGKSPTQKLVFSARLPFLNYFLKTNFSLTFNVFMACFMAQWSTTMTTTYRHFFNEKNLLRPKFPSYIAILSNFTPMNVV